MSDYLGGYLLWALQERIDALKEAGRKPLLIVVGKTQDSEIARSMSNLISATGTGGPVTSLHNGQIMGLPVYCVDEESFLEVVHK